MTKEFTESLGSRQVNVTIHYSGKKSLGVIVAVIGMKQIRKNELMDLIQQLEIDINDLKGERTKTILLDKLAR